LNDERSVEGSLELSGKSGVGLLLGLGDLS
jgi:hypothetical protein